MCRANLSAFVNISARIIKYWYKRVACLFANNDAAIAKAERVYSARWTVTRFQPIVLGGIVTADRTDVRLASKFDDLARHHCLRWVPLFQRCEPFGSMRREIWWGRSREVTIRYEPFGRYAYAFLMERRQMFI